MLNKTFGLACGSILSLPASLRIIKVRIKSRGTALPGSAVNGVIIGHVNFFTTPISEGLRLINSRKAVVKVMAKEKEKRKLLNLIIMLLKVNFHS